MSLPEVGTKWLIPDGITKDVPQTYEIIYYLKDNTEVCVRMTDGSTRYWVIPNKGANWFPRDIQLTPLMEALCL